MRIVIAGLCLILIQGCKKDLEFDAAWRQQEITVDGDDSEWHGRLTYFDRQSVAFGIINDSTDLYLLLKITDNAIRQTIMRTGLTNWFNADGRKKKKFGIRYPLGIAEFHQARPYDPSEWRDGAEERLRRQISGMLTEIEIIGPGEHDRTRIPVNNPYGISVGLTDTSAALIYEVIIPLIAADNLSYQIGAEPGNTIRVGLETGSMEGQMIVRRGSGQGGMAGSPGGGGVRRVGPPGGGSQRGLAEPLDLWIELHLATEN